MKINFSRFKVLTLGIIGLLSTIWVSINFIRTTVEFTSFETIVICFFIIQMIFLSLFFMEWGMEPYIPEFEAFEKKEKDEPK